MPLGVKYSTAKIFFFTSMEEIHRIIHPLHVELSKLSAEPLVPCFLHNLMTHYFFFFLFSTAMGVGRTGCLSVWVRPGRSWGLTRITTLLSATPQETVGLSTQQSSQRYPCHQQGMSSLNFHDNYLQLGRLHIYGFYGLWHIMVK